MNALQLLGRVLFGMIFVMNGVTGHFMRHAQLTEYAAAKGVPLAGVMVIITGVMILLGGLSVILGYKPKIGLWLLVAFLIPTALIMHNFWAVGAEQQMAEMSHFLKDSALGGAALMMIFFATDEPWPLSLGGGEAGAGTSSMGGTTAGPAGGPTTGPAGGATGTGGSAGTGSGPTGAA